MTDLVIVSENKKWRDEQYNPLTMEDIQELIEHRDVFIKLLKECRLNYQIELSKGGPYRGKEEMLYAAIDAMTHTIATVETAHETLKSFKEEEAKKEKK